MENSSRILENTNMDKAPKASKEVKIKKTIQITQEVIEDCLSTCLG
ncbi:hypothetical protein CLHOM_20320 [Clostridium homopropionicum DSM 5847]|uniref:Uncharacterized protein n=1 Tax=Clostridium homopropionicum DSM 5847 TaxID=1121318 RepID=A0A0L6ZAE7_9CLOT|nr:hypothetical protein [Clostridium homopropionicum]KOA19942.1 hypothetical protein CLHOM_20320 [Clostridium homopropionicum DSM 5847]SFG88119.1 hypothetical protein SAMN04488501_12128 [Clostridium homopropionicum]